LAEVFEGTMRCGLRGPQYGDATVLRRSEEQRISKIQVEGNDRALFVTASLDQLEVGNARQPLTRHGRSVMACGLE
jgi:hypothetical protein